MKTPRCLLLSLAAALLLAACASPIPKEIRNPATAGPSLAEVVADPQRHRGEQVRWGGEILAVENQGQVTWIEILARPLRAWGEPVDALGEGRFLARFAGFLDPAEYDAGRLLTVSGELVGSETRPVGGFDYLYPLVEVQAFHLWPEALPVRRSRYYDPFWHDPFWWPWWRPPYWPSVRYWPHPYHGPPPHPGPPHSGPPAPPPGHPHPPHR